MANLNSIIKGSKQLNQVANQIKNVALFYAPKDTGNLKRKINQANRPSNIIKVINGQNKSVISVSLDIAPTGAEYGKWFNDPPAVVKRTKLKETAERKGNWNFGKKALEDPSVKKEWDKFIKEFSDDYAEMIVKELKST